MATQQMIRGASSSSLVSLKKYGVFLSFRGEDTRRNITSHLYDALIRKRVETFIDDDELQKGDDISPALIKAIEESHISIVIFSQDYASSKWCLNELVKILECKNDWGQIVIPVFYNIDPSHVRKQIGSYQRAFAKYERTSKLNKEMLQKWKTYLFVAANLVGFDSTKYRNDSDLIKVIVEDVLQKLKHRYPFEVKETGLVGIEKKCKEMKSLLEIGSNDVRILGLWGMGGIGKTTLTRVLCAKLYSRFEVYCFLKNIREESKKHGPVVVRHRLFSALLEEDNLCLDAPYVETGHSIMMRRLLGKKMLIVLDDVATLKQIKCLIIDDNWLGPGSRVIITTRDKHIIRHAHAIYEVKELKECDSLELFCLNAFRENHPKIGYEELSKCANSYCKGNPLALEVLGARLGSRSKMAWESDFKKLQKIPDVEICNVLKLSLDDLDPTEKDIFLDIACFFKHENSNRVTTLLEACGFYATVGMEVLLDKALITINLQYMKRIEMHDLIQEMGRETVNEESRKNPGERSRLWKVEEVVEVLKNNKGTEVVEGLKLDCSKLVADLYLRSDSFKRMSNLRYLEIYNQSKECNLYFPDGLGGLANKLRYFRWDYFPLESLSPNFCAEMLVELPMYRSKLKNLWEGVQNLVNLKKIDLSDSKDLIEMPDLSRAANLEIVCLTYCKSLRELHPSILSLPKLEELNLSFCEKIESLKSNIHSKSLRLLHLSCCSSLSEFSVTSEEMTELSLTGTAISELSSSIWRNSKLEVLNLTGCDKLSIVGKKLSYDPGIVSLRQLHLYGCTQMDALNLSFLLDGIQSSLRELYLNDGYNLEALPHNIRNHSELEVLCLNGCTKLLSSSLTELLPPSLQCLSVVNCTLIDTDSTQRLLLENKLHNIKNENFEVRFKREFEHKFLGGGSFDTFLFIPGDQVSGKFDFQKRGDASITIPPIPKSNLQAFMFCIILSKGLHLDRKFTLDCFIYEQDKQVDKVTIHWGDNHVGTLISDHILLCLSGYDIRESGDDHYNLSFEFKHACTTDSGGKEWSTDGIKGCGILPVYGLDLDDKSSSRVEIVELESTSHVHEFQARAIGGEVRGFGNENEDDQLQISYYPEEEENEFSAKSSCGCSFGLLLMHLLGESRRLFLQLFKYNKTTS